MHHYEKLGSFYLGRAVDPESGGTLAGQPILYDAKDLTTHGVCVGMTGSGKTGLCLSLIEEAAIDGIPVIAIDPKGDLGNLLLTFPALRPSDFLPWVDPAEAARKGQSPEAFAQSTAETWRKGLADWDQDGARIQRLRDAADFCIYTPGSNAGRPITVLRSFCAPPPAVRDDAELLAERVDSATSGLLALMGIDADPLQSREHILLANLLRHEWELGNSIDLPGILRGIQQPPFQRVGFFDLESFFPAKDRLALAMRLNNLLASPGFQAWLEGDPLDIPSLLYAPDGRPRVSILSIAHLDEPQRMFFVTLLLNELIAWMRGQPGTSSLRALLYMDEIFGFFPPNGNPPAKRPMLTLLKQARAYGVGCMLATQNPVDLDYKGLANTGTWFIGRLQTERDKMRVMDGLEGASAGKAFDRAALERTISGLGNRRFLLHNVHDDAPVVFQTRWALCYLRGPMTRAQIRTLTQGEAAASTPAAPTLPPPVPPAATAPVPAASNLAPILPHGVPVVFLPPERPGPLRAWSPMLVGQARLHYVQATRGMDEWKDVRFAVALPGHLPLVKWEEIEELPGSVDFLHEAPAAAPYGPLPKTATTAKQFRDWESEAKAAVYERFTLRLYACKALKLHSDPGETEAAFRGRLQHVAREKRDVEVEALKRKYEARFNTLRDRIRRAEERIERETTQHKQAKMNTALSLGGTVLGALLGRKAASVGNVGRATSTLRGAGRIGKEKEDILRAEDEWKVQQQRLAELDELFQKDMQALETSYAAEALAVDVQVLPPRKTDLRIPLFGLGWRGIS